jgi:hypothetical protein
MAKQKESKLFTITVDPSVEGCSKNEGTTFTTTSTALAAWLVATDRLKFNYVNIPSRFEEDAKDYTFDDPTNIGECYLDEFYAGDPAVGARSMFNALAFLKEAE